MRNLPYRLVQKVVHKIWLYKWLCKIYSVKELKSKSLINLWWEDGAQEEEELHSGRDAQDASRAGFCVKSTTTFIFNLIFWQWLG